MKIWSHFFSVRDKKKNPLFQTQTTQQQRQKQTSDAVIRDIFD